MSKILKNTTALDIEISSLGLTIPALSQATIQVQDYLLLASEDSISELTTLINSEDIVVNDGVNDLKPIQGINHVKTVENFREKFTIHVDPNGSNSNGDGSTKFPVANLTGALNLINAGVFPDSTDTQLAIALNAGNYEQDPVDFSSLTSELVISGFGPKTRINATNVNEDLVTLGNNATVINCSFGGVTNSSNYNLVWRTTNGGLGSGFGIRVETGSNAIAAFNTSGTFRLTINSPLLGVCTGTLVECNDNCVVTVNSLVGLGNSSSTIGVSQKGSGNLLLFGGRFTLCDKAIQVNGDTGLVFLSGISAPNTNTALDQIGNSLIEILGGNFDVRTSNVTNTANIEGWYFQETPEENQLLVLSELSVGLPNKGKETVLGEGDSYVLGQLVYTFNGSTFTNESTSAASPQSSTFTFPNNNVNSAIYVSTAFDTTNPLTFPGIKAQINTAAILGSGDIVFEYWNGSSWAEFNHMLTESNPPHRALANSKFKQTGSTQIYFDTNIVNNWQTNDPVSLGINLYWIRFRINGSSITSSPVFEQFKIHTNRFEIEQNGFQTMYGNGRIKEKFPISFGGLFATTGKAPNSSNIYLSDNLSIAATNNSFPTNQSRSIVFSQFLPFEIDTSSPIEVTISYFGDDSNSGTVQWTVNWATSDINEGVYASSVGAPSTSINERSLTVLDSFNQNENNQDKIQTFKLEIPEAISQENTGSPKYKLWLQLQRTVTGPDNYAGNIILTDFSLYYTAWREGGYVGEF